MDTQAGSLLLDVALVAVLVLVGVRLYRRRRPAASVAATPEPARKEISSRQEAEQAAASHLSGLGFGGVRRTEDPVRLVGDSVVAQVVWRAKPVGVEAVQQLKAAAGERRPVLYSFAGCTRAAGREAGAAGVALFRLRVDGEAVAENDAARAIDGTPSDHR